MRSRRRAVASDSARARTGSPPQRASSLPCDQAAAPRRAGKSPEPAGGRRIRWTVSPSSDCDFDAALGCGTRARSSVRLPTPSRPLQLRAQELSRRGGGIGRELLRRALRDHVASLLSALRSEVDKPVGGLEDVEVVLDHDTVVAVLDEAVQHDKESLYVRVVKAGGRRD